MYNSSFTAIRLFVSCHHRSTSAKWAVHSDGFVEYPRDGNYLLGVVPRHEVNNPGVRNILMEDVHQMSSTCYQKHNEPSSSQKSNSRYSNDEKKLQSKQPLIIHISRPASRPQNKYTRENKTTGRVIQPEELHPGLSPTRWSRTSRESLNRAPYFIFEDHPPTRHASCTSRTQHTVIDGAYKLLRQWFLFYPWRSVLVERLWSNVPKLKHTFSSSEIRGQDTGTQARVIDKGIKWAFRAWNVGSKPISSPRLVVEDKSPNKA